MRKDRMIQCTIFATDQVEPAAAPNKVKASSVEAAASLVEVETPTPDGPGSSPRHNLRKYRFSPTGEGEG
jgi:hypothetical protein